MLLRRPPDVRMLAVLQLTLAALAAGLVAAPAGAYTIEPGHPRLYFHMTGTSKAIPAGDMIMRDAAGLSCALIYGQDNRSPIRPRGRTSCTWPMGRWGWCGAVESHLELIEEHVRVASPRAVREQWRVLVAYMPRVPAQEFERLPLRVRGFLAGVPLHDVWAIDLPRPRAGITFADFVRAAGGRPFRPSRVVRALLSARFFIGRLLGWDRESDAAVRTTFATRLTADDRSRSLAPTGVKAEVSCLENADIGCPLFTAMRGRRGHASAPTSSGSSAGLGLRPSRPAFFFSRSR